MSIRIPPSLMWLAKKRSLISGQIKSAEKEWKVQVARNEKHFAQLADAHQQHIHILTGDLAAIDHALRLHEIPVNPALIPAIRFQARPTTSGYGQMTRAIYKALAATHPHPATTTKIVAFVKIHMNLELSADELTELRYRVRLRLRCLYAKGTITRLHPRSTQKEGSWRLKLDVQDFNGAPIALEVAPEKPGAT